MGTQHIIRKSLLFALPAFTMTINVRIEIKLHIIHDLANHHMIFRVDSRVESTSYCTSVLPPPPLCAGRLQDLQVSDKAPADRRDQAQRNSRQAGHHR